MTTVIDGPFVIMTDQAIPPRRRRRDTIEIIDVDELDDEELAAMQRPLQRRRIINHARQAPDTILLLDSDDDEPQIITPTSSSQSGASRQRLTSLPPPPQNNNVPPVPPIPRRFTGHQGMPPMRHRPPSFPDGLVRPISQPFSFEAQMQAGPSIHRSNSNNVPPGPPPAAPLPAAPPSHHVPSMGFGGAILQMNSEMNAQERRTRRGPRQPGVQPRGRPIRHIYMPFGMHDDINEDFLFEPSIFSEMDMIMRVLGNYRGGGGGGYRDTRKEPEYLSTYTHPVKPEAGFVFDFATDDTTADGASTSFPVTSSDNPIVIMDDGDGVGSSASGAAGTSSTSTQMQTLLVCACCSKPLLLNSHTSSRGPEEERNRRIWALRCGHLIDGECLANISTPVVPPVESAIEYQQASKGKGKGKAKAAESDVDSGIDDLLATDSEEEEDELLPPPRYSLRRRGGQTNHPVPPVNDYDIFLSPSGYPLRSRLLPAPLAPPLSGKSRRGRAPRNQGKRGAGGRDNKKKQEVFEWLCPVPGCERIHASVRVGEGEWEMEKDMVVGRGKSTKSGRGAIAVFV